MVVLLFASQTKVNIVNYCDDWEIRLFCLRYIYLKLHLYFNKYRYTTVYQWEALYRVLGYVGMRMTWCLPLNMHSSLKDM